MCCELGSFCSTTCFPQPPWIVNQSWKSGTYISHILVQIISNGVQLYVDAWNFVYMSIFFQFLVVQMDSFASVFLGFGMWPMWPGYPTAVSWSCLTRDKHQGHWLYPGCGSDATPHLQWFGWYTWRSRRTNSTLLRVCFWYLASRFLCNALWVSGFSPSVLRTVWHWPLDKCQAWKCDNASFPSDVNNVSRLHMPALMLAYMFVVSVYLRCKRSVRYVLNVFVSTHNQAISMPHSRTSDHGTCEAVLVDGSHLMFKTVYSLSPFVKPLQKLSCVEQESLVNWIHLGPLELKCPILRSSSWITRMMDPITWISQIIASIWYQMVSSLWHRSAVSL